MIFAFRTLGAGLLGIGAIALLLHGHSVGPGALLSDRIGVAWLACLGLGLGLTLGSIPREAGAAGRWLFRWRLARALAVTVIVIGLLGAVLVFVHQPPTTGREDLIALGFVAFLSGTVGFAELAQRYRDDPLRLLAADTTVLYVCINVAAGIGAFALVKEFAVFDEAKPHAAISQVMLASFGAIAFFRSSLFTARVGDVNVDVGPSTLLKGLLETSDRLINRSQARDRADDAASIMKDVDFGKAKTALPAFCFTVVENVTQDEQERFGASVNTLSAAENMTGEQRSIILGVYLMRIVGPLVLARAISALGVTIRR